MHQIENAINFVHRRIEHTVPFQFDICFVAHGAPELACHESEDDEYESDSDDYDMEDQWSSKGRDHVGDIEEKLKANKLIYYKSDDHQSKHRKFNQHELVLENGKRTSRARASSRTRPNENVFDNLFRQFGPDYELRSKRIVSFVDLREKFNNGHVYPVDGT